MYTLNAITKGRRNALAIDIYISTLWLVLFIELFNSKCSKFNVHSSHGLYGSKLHVCFFSLKLHSFVYIGFSHFIVLFLSMHNCNKISVRRKQLSLKALLHLGFWLLLRLTESKSYQENGWIFQRIIMRIYAQFPCRLFVQNKRIKWMNLWTEWN